MTNYIAVRVDDENNADAWWGALTERYPNFARSLRRNGAAVIAAPLYAEVADLTGFSGGPDYAPDALIDCGNEGDQWGDVVAGRHEVFDALS